MRQKFTGYQKDTESGLDYAKARMYGGSYGRFTSPDPLMASAKKTSPQSWNRYVYVLNNPLKLVDPSGMIWGSYIDKNNQQHFHYFKGDAGSFQGHDYGAYTGSRVITNTQYGTVELNKNSNGFRVLKSSPATAQNRTPQASGASGGGYVNSGLINQLANNTAPMPRAMVYFGAAAAAGGVACAAFCPAIAAAPLTTLGLGGTAAAESAATHPEQTAEIAEATVVAAENAGTYLAQKAPFQIGPGPRVLEGQRFNDLGRLEPWRAYYDGVGRQIGRTDFNAGNKAAGIPDVHSVIYGYNNGVRFTIENHIPGEF